MQRSPSISAALRSLWESAYREKSTGGWNLYHKSDALNDVVLVGSGGVSRETGKISHTWACLSHSQDICMATSLLPP